MGGGQVFPLLILIVILLVLVLGFQCGASLSPLNHNLNRNPPLRFRVSSGRIPKPAAVAPRRRKEARSPKPRRRHTYSRLFKAIQAKKGGGVQDSTWGCKSQVRRSAFGGGVGSMVGLRHRKSLWMAESRPEAILPGEVEL